MNPKTAAPQHGGVTCISCGSSVARPIPNHQARLRVFPDRSLVRCRVCGLAWPDPLPTFEDVRDIYESDSLKHAYAEAFDTIYVAGSESAAPYIVERIEHLTEVRGGPGRILDIGAAQGAFLRACRDRGWTVAGIELSPEGRDYARAHHNLELLDRPVEQAGFQDASFDAIHMNHVLEHLIDPVGTLKELRRILAPGGWLAIEVPNEIDELFVAITTTLGRPPKPYQVPSPHIYHFNAGSLRRVLEACGFEVKELSTPRRNASLASRIPLGGLAKRALFKTESLTLRGPVVVALSRKPCP